MRRIKANIDGFTFVETIICFTIVGIFLALTWATLNFLLSKTTDQIVQARAHFLAVEGMENLYQLRQTAVNNHYRDGFFEVMGNLEGEYVLKKQGETYLLSPGSNQVIEINEDPYIRYCRTVYLEGSQADFKKAIVEVTWGDNEECTNNEKQIAYSTYFYQILQ